MAERSEMKLSQKWLENILDDLQLTDRVYFHLNMALPLTLQMIQRVQAASAGGKVLMLGGNTLMAHALLRLGFELEIWQLKGGHLADDLSAHITRHVSVEELSRSTLDIEKQRYSAIVFAYLMESLSIPPDAFLTHLKSGLIDGGSIILAITNLSSLVIRLKSLTGKNFLPNPDMPSIFSFSWTALPVVRYYHQDEIIQRCRKAGFRVQEFSYVRGTRAFQVIEPLGFQQYLSLQLSHILKGLFPSTRDVLLLHISPRVADEIVQRERANNLDPPFVSVFVSSQREGASLRETLSSLQDQTYPLDRFEVVVIHTGVSTDVTEIISESITSSPPVREYLTLNPEGPEIRNSAMTEAQGTICAHTDDACHLPADWLLTAVESFDENTAVLSGPSIPSLGSGPRFPGIHKLDPGEHDAALFRISNVFYRRAVALAAGGFNTSYSNKNGTSRFGWDTELAWRIKRLGWETQFALDVYTYRTSPWLSRLRWIPEQWRKARDIPRLVADVPELKEALLTNRYFASKQTLYFNLLLASILIVAVTGWWPLLLLGVPWVVALSERLDFWPPRQWITTARIIVRWVLRHFIWLGGFLFGSIRARRLVM
jgi:glycosyltransferase involved in cell wall biosynthesis